MSLAAAIVILVYFSALCVLAGVVWGGPWPPTKIVADGQMKAQKRWQGMSMNAAGQALAAAVFIWFVPFRTVWFRYAIFMLLPLVIGIVVRRIWIRYHKSNEELN